MASCSFDCDFPAERYLSGMEGLQSSWCSTTSLKGLKQTHAMSTSNQNWGGLFDLPYSQLCPVSRRVSRSCVDPSGDHHDHDQYPTRSWYKRNEIAVTPWLFLIPGIFFLRSM
jgi:hypothetical protein